MQASNRTRERPLDLTIVGGAYKSGTSVLCESIERRGYANPAWLTNPGEHGHGADAGIYLTRECSIARDLNRRLVKAGPKEVAMLEGQLAEYLSEMMFELGPRLVLKDPYMKITAAHWFNAARFLGADALNLALTSRELPAVRRAWARSRLLSLKERSQTEEFRALVSPLGTACREELGRLGVTTLVVRYGRTPGTRGSDANAGDPLTGAPL